MTQVSTTLAERKHYVKKFPWVKWSPVEHVCEGWHSASQGKHQCKNAAHWVFKHHKPKDEWDHHKGETRKYCWNHLFSRGFYDNMCEERRMLRWMKQNPPPWSNNNIMLGD